MSDIDDAVRQLWPQYQQVLQDVIRIPSLLGDETRAQQYLAEVAEKAGLDVDLWEVDPAQLRDDPDYAPVDGGDRPRPNLTAVLPGTGGGRSLAVSGHVDVVPIAPAHRWQH